MLNSIKRFVSESSIAKTFIFFSCNFVAAILGGWFLEELKFNDKIDWSRVLSTKSGYLIIIYLAVVYFYNAFLRQEDEKIEKFKDKEYCRAYARKHYLSSIVDKISKSVEAGKIPEEFKEDLGEIFK